MVTGVDGIYKMMITLVASMAYSRSDLARFDQAISFRANVLFLSMKTMLRAEIIE